MTKAICKYTSLLAIILLCITAVSGQAKSTDVAENYQKQQRAFNLTILKADIKLVEDAAMRCFLRLQIIRYIFVNKIANYSDVANTLAVECLDETVAFREEFSTSQYGWIKNEVSSLLKRYSPAVFTKVEKKYFANTDDLDFSDTLELNSGGDPNKIVNRIISKMAKSGISGEILGIISLLDTRDKAAKFRLLSAVLAYYESHYNQAFSGNTFMMLSSDYIDAATPSELKKRFHAFLITLGEAAISDSKNEDMTRVCLEIFLYALPAIKEVSPDLYPKASAIYLSLNSKKSQEDKEWDEIYTRIRESKDKLAQTISEAESATDIKGLKSRLWMYAAQYALQDKKFRIAATSQLKMDDHGNEMVRKAHYFFVTEQVLNPCLKENDIDSAEYIVNLVEDPEMRSTGLFKIAAKLVELKKQDAAFDKLNEGLKAVEKMDTGQPKIRQMLSAIPIALKIDKTRAFDIAGEAVKVINRLPTPGPDDKPGSEARQKYVETVLTPVSYNLETTFRLLGKENMALAEPISQGIQLKDWQLGIRVALEKERLYPLPPELDKKPKEEKLPDKTAKPLKK